MSESGLSTSISKVLGKCEISLNVGTEELVAIAVDKYETSIRDAIAEMEQNRIDLNKQLKEQRNSLDQYITTTMESHVRKYSQRVVDALTDCGFVAVQVKGVIVAQPNKNDVKPSFTFSVVVESGNSNNSRSLTSASIVSHLDDPRCSLLKDIEDLEKQIETASEELVNARRQLQDREYVKNSARAAIAKMSLGKLDGGSELLNALDAVEGSDARVKRRKKVS